MTEYYGNLESKRKLRNNVNQTVFSEFERKNPAWKEWHKKTLRIYEDSTTYNEGLPILQEILREMAVQYCAGKLNSVERNWGSEIISNMVVVYPEKLDELYDSDYYKLAELMSWGRDPALISEFLEQAELDIVHND